MPLNAAVLEYFCVQAQILSGYLSLQSRQTVWEKTRLTSRRAGRKALRKPEDRSSRAALHSLAMNSHNRSELHVLCSSGQLLLQPLWDRLRAWDASAHASFSVFSITTMWAACLWCRMRASPGCHAAALQDPPGLSPPARQLLHCRGQMLYQHVVSVFPMTLLHWALSPALPARRSPRTVPARSHVVLCLLLFDTEFFVHLLHHSPGYTGPSTRCTTRIRPRLGWPTQYMSVGELFSLGFFDMMNVCCSSPTY